MYEQRILRPFYKMAQLYENPNIESENWKLRTFTIRYPEDYYTIFSQGIPPGTYVSLNCKHPERFGMNQSCMMSDTPMEKFTNQHILNYATGDILIAGLGIGLLPASLAEKEDVKSITIIELNQEVIDLVEPLIRQHVKNAEKIKIIQADAHQYPKLHQDERYDWIYLDIWDTFPGYEEDLPMLDAMIEQYLPLCPSCRVSAWGYEFAEAGLDDSPIEVDAYNKYLHDLKQWEMVLESSNTPLEDFDFDFDLEEEEDVEIDKVAFQI